MIKLVASDMDGTLLTDDKKLPPDMFELIEKMNSCGIIFVPASGRQVCSLERFFAPFIDTMPFIAENGSLVTYKGKELFSSSLDPRCVHEILEDIFSLGKHAVLLCGKRNSYTDDFDSYKLMKSSLFRYNVEYRENLFDVDDEILKISVVDNNNVKERYFNRLLPKYKCDLGITLSGFNCMDFMNKGVSKGSALKLLRELFSLSTENVASFGDNFNDVEMFSESSMSFAMEKSSTAVKAKAKFVAGDNNKFAVAEEIKRICQI